MIELIATVSSLEQAKALLESGVDCLYFGEDRFGLRLPYSFSRDEQQELIQLAHRYQKKVSIAVNGIFHNEHIQELPAYLRFLKDNHVDSITLGDPGCIQVMRTQDLWIPYRYDAQVMVTSSKHINFWAKRGAIGAVLARELPKASLARLLDGSQVPVEVLVYGATCIHQSKRPLLVNYFNYIQTEHPQDKQARLHLSEPDKPDTHYAIYEDQNGTHIFANNDISLAPYLTDLTEMGVTQWKLDGLFVEEDDFVAIAQLFVQARDALISGKPLDTASLVDKIAQLHPQTRGLDAGFYILEPGDVQ